MGIEVVHGTRGTKGSTEMWYRNTHTHYYSYITTYFFYFYFLFFFFNFLNFIVSYNHISCLKK